MSSIHTGTKDIDRSTGDWRLAYAKQLASTAPKGWSIQTIGDIAEIKTGKLDANAADTDGKYPFFTCAKKISRIDTPAFDGEAVLVAGNGDFNVKYYLGKFNAYQRTYVIQNIETLGKYLYFYIQYRLSDLTGDSRGSTIKYIRLGDLRDYPVPIAPLEQQVEIVSEIEKQFSRLDKAVANLKRVKANLKRYKAAVLKAAVEGKLTEEWRKQNPDVEPASKLLERILTERRKKWEEAELARMKEKAKEPKNDKWKEKFGLSSHVDIEGMPNLPDKWCYANLASLVEEPKYGTSKKCRYESRGLGVLRIPNIGDGVIDDDDLKYAEFDAAEIAAYRLQENDLLIIRSNGSLDLVGKAALVREPDCSHLYAGYLIRLRPISATVSGAFLQFAVRSLVVRQQIESKAKSTSGVNNINAKELKTLTIPLCSKGEQTQLVWEIEGRLSVADHLLNDVEMRIKNVECLRQSILARSFSGHFARVKPELHVLEAK